MQSRPDYYKILGLKSDATLAEVKKAFKQLALQYHPDKQKDSADQSKFREILEAYNILLKEVSEREEVAKQETKPNPPFSQHCELPYKVADNKVQAKIRENLKDADKIALFCLDLLREDKPNGVACALNNLTLEERKDLLLRFLKPQYLIAQETKEEHQSLSDLKLLLAAYYSSPQEWAAFPKELSVEKIKELLASKTLLAPPALFHALEVKLAMYDIFLLKEKIKEEWYSQHPNSTFEAYQYLSHLYKTDKMVEAGLKDLQGKLLTLLSKSTLHLNLRGLEFRKLDSTLDGLQTEIKLNGSMLDLSYSYIQACALVETDMMYSDFRGSEWFNAGLRNCSFTGSVMPVYFFCCDFQNINFNLVDFQNATMAFGGRVEADWFSLATSDFRNAIINNTIIGSRPGKLGEDFFKDGAEEALKYLSEKNEAEIFPMMIKLKNSILDGKMIEKFTAHDGRIFLWLLYADDVGDNETIRRINSLKDSEMQALSPFFQRALVKFREPKQSYGGFFSSSTNVEKDIAPDEKPKDDKSFNSKASP